MGRGLSKLMGRGLSKLMGRGVSPVGQAALVLFAVLITRLLLTVLDRRTFALL